MKAGWFCSPPRNVYGAHAVALTPERKLILVQASLRLRLAPARRRPERRRESASRRRSASSGEEIGMTAHGRVRLACELERDIDYRARPAVGADCRGCPLLAAALVVGSRADHRSAIDRSRRTCRRSRGCGSMRSKTDCSGACTACSSPSARPKPIRDLLIDAMDDSADFRWQDEEQLHLTLRFIGEVERPVANDLADALTRVTRRAFRAAHRRHRPFRAAQQRRTVGGGGAEGARCRTRRQGRARLCRSRAGARAPRLPSARHARPVERPPDPRSRGLPGAMPARFRPSHLR